MFGRREIVFILLLLTSSVLFAQEKWSLEDCIDYALKNNLDIESQRIASEANKEILAQSKRNRLTYIDAGTNYNYASSAVFENADSVYSMAVQHLPDVEAKQQELNAVEKNLAIARGQLSTSVALFGGYYTGYYETRTDEQGNPISFRDQFSNNASQSVGVRLSIPIFTRWRTRSKIKLSKLDLEAKMVELQNYKNQLYYEIESYCQELSATSAEYFQAKKQTESNELAFEVDQKKKEQGMINILEFYTSKNLLSNVQGELLRTKLQYIIKRKTIDFYMGNPVFGIGKLR